MPNGPPLDAVPTLVGRSSSHFTRLARIFAAELEVETQFRVVPDLSSIDARDYGDNPALSVPVLETAQGVWFGSLNVCRELARRSRLGSRVVWPEALDQPLSANALELTLHAMSAEVALIMGSIGAGAAGASTLGGVQREKLQRRLQACLGWLDQHLPALLQSLPPRDLSYLEVALFCLVTHLGFRGILATAPYLNLTQFSERFGERPSALATPFRFDAPPAPASR